MAILCNSRMIFCISASGIKEGRKKTRKKRIRGEKKMEAIKAERGMKRRQGREGKGRKGEGRWLCSDFQSRRL